MAALPSSNRSPPVPITARLWSVIALMVGMMAAYCFLLWPEWKQNADLSHGFFAPLIFLILIRESRQGDQRWLSPSPWSTAALACALAAGFVLFALAGLLAASVAWTHSLVIFVLGASLVCFLFGGLLVLADARAQIVPLGWISVTAIFLWLLASPLPNGTYARLTITLQHGVTSGVLTTLQLIGIPARQHGNIIELTRTTVGVEEACSGIRSLISCVYAGFFFAAWQVRRPLRRLALIAIAPILALGMNFVRSLLLTLLANAGKDIGGFWHDITGFGILALTAAILAWLAIRLETKETAAREHSLPPPSRLLPPSTFYLIWVSGVASLALGIFYYANSRPANNTGKPIPNLAGMLPLHPDGWQVATSKDLYQFADILQTTHLVERTYVRPTDDGQFVQLTVYLAYWPAGQATVSRVASHTPDACWPGSGWTALPVTDSRQIPVLPGQTLSIAEHRMFRSNDGFLQNVWFWHVYDGRTIDYRDPYSVSALLHLAVNYGFRRQGDQYFVRLSSNRPWSTLATEPLVREIFTQLASIGL